MGEKPKKREPRAKKKVPEARPWTCKHVHPNSSPPPSRDFIPTCSDPGCDARDPRSSSVRFFRRSDLYRKMSGRRAQRP